MLHREPERTSEFNCFPEKFPIKCHPRYPAPDGVVDVWRYALDLRDLEVAPEHGEDNLMVLYHYTNELGFED